jgi:single-strand DNA-binding protein
MSDTGDTITITGNVATPPELKRTSGGVAIATFRVASGQRKYDRAAGAWSDAGTNWYTVSVFRSLADHAYASLNKGDRVILTGRLRLREWDNGTKRGTAIEIDAEAIGHDLLWGTTTFVRDSQLVTTASNRAGSTTGDPPAWAAPGVDAGQSGDQSAGRVLADMGSPHAAELALVGAGSGATPHGAAEEAPF